MGRKHMQIGEVAERTGLSLRTIRHYEEVGLAPPTARSQGGFRLYTEDDVARLLMIRRMKPLGFSLEEMRDLLSVLDALDSPHPPADRRAELDRRLAEYRTRVDRRCAELRDLLADAEQFAAELSARLHDRQPH
ncbi:MerR family transcriptional regulator [Thermomonospora cellulosilytica]|uniref:DNA-binding transcriptional MerR regulator n=1 Tax=Thermomonospora cellulosilytica TaxID=1411118 RepID=A0A7W3R758_9ACTN|nr:MerR family transcriptional regulator [Thermomonospora cellulosilytica]MBA9002357.1 DNA-binding transcriptional MerR regulator [Thermomonospora cellulosilytica]